MQQVGVKVNGGATTAIDSLSDAARDYLFEVVGQLQTSDPSAWPADTVVTLPGTEPMYLLRFPPDYRVTLRRNGSGELEIMDVVRAEMLQRWFADGGPNGGGHG